MLEIVLSLSSMILSGIAVVFLKKGVESVPVEKIHSPFSIVYLIFQSKSWFLGGSLLLLGWLLRFICINLSDLSYVRIIYVNHLLIVIIFSRYVVKEKIDSKLLFAVIVMLGGLLCVAGSPPLTRGNMGNLSSYIIYAIIIFALFISCILAAFFFKGAKNFFIGIGSACSFGLGALTQGLFAVNAFDLESIIDIQFYLSLILNPLFYMMVIFSLLGFILSNVVMRKFRISLLYSIFYPVSEIIVLFGSIVVFNENFDFLTNGFRMIGTILIMIGLFILVTTQRTYIVPSPLINKKKQ